MADGICYEEVKIKTLPSSANASKTFKKVYSFKEVKIYIDNIWYNCNVYIVRRNDCSCDVWFEY